MRGKREVGAWQKKARPGNLRLCADRKRANVAVGRRVLEPRWHLPASLLLSFSPSPTSLRTPSQPRLPDGLLLPEVSSKPCIYPPITLELILLLRLLNSCRLSLVVPLLGPLGINPAHNFIYHLLSSLIASQGFI